MSKFIAASAAVLMSTMLAGSALANDDVNANVNSSASTDTSVASAADLACMGTAVDTRESAVLTARTDFNARIIAALQTRRASLKTAYTIANNADRKVAIKAALSVFAKANADARTQYKTDVKAAWKVFADASKACRTDADVRVKEDTKEEHDNGRHLGQLKKKVRNAFEFNANGRADVDLSF